MRRRRVVMTSTAIPVSAQDLEVFAGLGVEFEAIDGTDRQLLLAGTRDADALIVLAETIDREVIENLTRCRSITRFGIGFDTIDVTAADERGVWVTNVPDANYREVAVHAIALALSLSRRLPALDAGIRRDGWVGSIFPGVHRPDTQVFGLLGLGRIGRRVATMAAAIGYEVITADPVISEADAAAVGARAVSRSELFTRSNVLSLHVPLSAATRHIVDSAALASMKPGSILVNVSRGGLIDEDALADALRSGHLFGAGLDVFEQEPLAPDSPLRSLDTVILTPHAAHWSEESWDETRAKVFAEAARVLRGEPPLNPVNHPLRDSAR